MRERSAQIQLVEESERSESEPGRWRARRTGEAGGEQGAGTASGERGAQVQLVEREARRYGWWRARLGRSREGRAGGA